MKKRFFSLALCILLCFSMVCPSVLADDSVPEHEHKWVDCGINFDGEVKEIPVSVSVQQCSVCKMYLHSFNILGNVIKYPAITGYTTMTNELVQFLAPYVAQLLGKNATAEKAPSGIGRKDLPGYADDKGTASIGADGKLHLTMLHSWSRAFLSHDYLVWQCEHSSLELYSDYVGNMEINQSSCSIPFKVTGDWVKSTSTSFKYRVRFYAIAPVSGYYEVPNQTIGKMSYQGYHSADDRDITVSLSRKFYTKGKAIEVISSFSPNANTYTNSFILRYNQSPVVTCEPYDSDYLPVSNSVTINNNTWNGNIYTDNSTNLTYIYPQYTTVNENNETVTNISNTPIIYNNETKQYYTYDQTTKNYYYITYNAPSPSPTPAPTEKPGGSISTPETGKPGGDTGDTTGILAVLVEIRDNMIRGFLDIKAAFVAGFAELSANFTLAIENLNVNIQNIFNKKFPDQSTPETAQPTPTPSPEPTETPSPTDPPSPTPSPSPAPSGKPDGGGDTNNFWNIFIGGGSDDGTDGDHKGIFWALVSLILALIAFFTNLFAGVAYLFPFLPEGVVMTINTCLFVVFLFVIIKFIMRSK